MDPQPSDDEVSVQADQAIARAQQLDFYKQQLMKDLADEGADADGARIFVASRDADGRIRVDRVDGERD